MNNKIRSILVVLMVSSILFSTSESIFLPAVRAASNSPKLGIMAYIDTGSDIDLDYAKSLFKTVNIDDPEEIEGIYSFYTDGYNTEDVNVYITSEGLILAFYTDRDPTSRIITWNGDKTIFSKLGTAISNIGKSLKVNINFNDVRYYHYKYPDANRMLIVTQSVGESIVGGSYSYGNLQFNIPSDATIYEVSYSFYLNDANNMGANVAVDTNKVADMAKNGVSYGFYNGYISKDTDHLLGVMSNMYAQSGVAMIIIYKDDEDDTRNRASILINNADNSFDGVLEIPVLPSPTTVPTYDDIYEPTPVPTYISTPVVTIHMPTAVITQEPTPVSTSGTSPVQTTVQPVPGPSTASVLLTSEKTDIELGEDAILKLSAVSLITKPKMTVQVIIRVPSGVSVTATEFSQTGTNQYTSKYELQPGDNRDVEVKIRANHPGTFNVTGRIVYYFGGDISTGEDHTQEVTISVKPKGSAGVSGGVQTVQSSDTPKKKFPIPGFETILGIGILSISYLFSRKKRYT